MLDRAFLQMIDDLVTGDAVRPSDPERFLEFVNVEVAHPPEARFAVPHELGERADRLFQRVAARPMQEIDVEVIRTEPPQTRLTRAQDPLVRGVLREHFGDEEDLTATSGDRLAHEFLDPAGSVHLGRIDVRHPGVEPRAEGADRLAASVSLHVPRTLADHGYVDAGPPEGPLRHRIGEGGPR